MKKRRRRKTFCRVLYIYIYISELPLKGIFFKRYFPKNKIIQLCYTYIYIYIKYRAKCFASAPFFHHKFIIPFRFNLENPSQKYFLEWRLIWESLGDLLTTDYSWLPISDQSMRNARQIYENLWFYCIFCYCKISGNFS